VDVGGYLLENDQGDGTTPQAGVLPSGTLVAAGSTIVIARNCTQAEFEAYWGVTLPQTTLFFMSGNANTGVPVINGGERWRIYNAVDAPADGFTVPGETGKSYQRRQATGPDTMGAWAVGPESAATPGTSDLGPSDRGVFISEWSDASGTGNWVYEFVEIYVNP
jgi:hypothetical protein